jgi:hypothetical protein
MGEMPMLFATLQWLFGHRYRVLARGHCVARDGIIREI